MTEPQAADQVHVEAGQATFEHECEQAGARSVTIAWGAGYPAIQPPKCPECGGTMLENHALAIGEGRLQSEQDYVAQESARRAEAVKAASDPRTSPRTLEERIQAATEALLAPQTPSE